MESIKYILEFTFQSFWHFIGILLLCGAVFGSIARIFQKETIIYRDKEKE